MSTAAAVEPDLPAVTLEEDPHSQYKPLAEATPEPEVPVTGERWKAVLVVEGVRTTDRREIGVDALTWRDLPLPLMLLDETGAYGHAGAAIAGTIESISKVDNRYEATGTFDVGDAGTEAARLVRAQTLRWVSADLEVTDVELIGEPPMLLLFHEEEEAEEAEDWWERITEGRIMGATVLAMPAFPQAVIVMEDQDWPAVTPDNGLPTDIAASGALQAPPREWFENPGLSEPTHLTVSDDGRISGHLCTWGTRHTSFGDRVVTPPRDCSPEYPYFRTGRTRCADGSDVPTGVITLGGGHASGGLGWRPAIEHYDEAGTAACRVACGNDEHGVWLAGALFPGLGDEEIQLLRALDISGDWRSIGGRLELVAALVVNVPGFPIPSLAASGHLSAVPAFDGRTRAGVHDGEQISLVAAGVVHRDPLGDLRREMHERFARVDAILNPLRPLAVEALARRVEP